MVRKETTNEGTCYQIINVRFECLELYLLGIMFVEYVPALIKYVVATILQVFPSRNLVFKQATSWKIQVLSLFRPL